MKSLFDEVKIGSLTVKNRTVRSATHDGYADEKGHLTATQLQMYTALAQGGVGLIITGLTYVTKREPSKPGQSGNYDDSFQESYRKLPAVIHQYGAKIVQQLACLGSQTTPDTTGERVLWGPSEVPDLAEKGTPTPMTQGDMLYVEEAFAQAACRAREAGFDGVQLHAAHGYLLSKFLTPYYNRRRDAYGGSIENRARLLLETYRHVREKVGPDFPILVKINCDDFMEAGLTFEECGYVCRELDRLGIDAIEISGGSPSSRRREGVIRRVTPETQSYFQPYGAAIAGMVEAPVILVGGNRDYYRLTQLINSTEIEMLSFCRPLIRESSLIHRWQAGLTEEAACISCSKCFREDGTRCIFN